MFVADSASPALPAAEPAASEPIAERVGLSSWLAARADLVLRLGLFGIILIAVAYFTFETIPTGNLSDIGDSTFISVGNLQDIGRQMAVVGVIAIGETFVIITAGIDLSVGSLLGLTGVLTAEAFLAG